MARRPDFPCAGGCACGAVRYRLVDDPIELHVCHCTDCQTVTGSAFVMSMMVRRRSVEVVQGVPEPIEFDTPSGIHRTDARCAACGVRLWSESRQNRDLLALRPGTLDDTGWCVPVAHIWTRSAQPWVPIPDDVLCYDEQPSDEEMLVAVRAWKAR